MNILGINIGHDRAAAILQGGEIVSYIAEERLDRVKHSYSDALPMLAIRYVLEEAKLDFHEIDAVGLSSAYVTKESLQTLVREIVSTYFRNALVEVVGHHLSHACTAYYCSPFENAAIWIADGGGDVIVGKGQAAESYYVGSGTQINHLYTRFQPDLTLPFDDDEFRGSPKDQTKSISLGRKYEQITYLLGFRFGQAGKTMGLASYGRDSMRWRPAVRAVGTFEPDLRVRHIVASLEKDLRQAKLSDLAADAAAEVQSLVEECALLCLEHLYEESKVPNLCIAGGVGLNCVLNSRILRDSRFSSLFVFPAAGDDGQAIGNALYCHFRNGGRHRPRFVTASLGRTYSSEAIKSALLKAGVRVRFSQSENIVRDTARLLTQGAIVGWLQGGTECGPRALGFRSILADPRDPKIKDKLNDRVKHRENFRPFAPAVLEEFAPDFFSYPQSDSLAFMLLTAWVHPHKRSLIPGVTHVDGSARLQTVNKTNNGALYALIESFRSMTGIPVLLNTSFNVAGEPLVESPEDAIKCFLSTGIDYLVMNNFLIEK